MTHPTGSDKGLHHLPASPAGTRPTCAAINRVLLHDDIVRPELCDDAILATRHNSRNQPAAHSRHGTH